MYGAGAPAGSRADDGKKSFAFSDEGIDSVTGIWYLCRRCYTNTAARFWRARRSSMGFGLGRRRGGGRAARIDPMLAVAAGEGNPAKPGAVGAQGFSRSSD